MVETGAVPRYGTYHGNPLATAAVSSTMELLDTRAYETIFSYGSTLRSIIVESVAREGIPVTTCGFDSVSSLWFGETLPRT